MRAPEASAVTFDDFKRGAGWRRLDPESGEPVEPANDHSQSPLAGGARVDPDHTIRVDGTAQTASTAMASREKIWTEAETSIATWKATATHTAKQRLPRHHSPAAMKSSVRTISGATPPVEASVCED